MIADHIARIEGLESGFWRVTDNLRTDSALESNWYLTTILKPESRARCRLARPVLEKVCVG